MTDDLAVAYDRFATKGQPFERPRQRAAWRGFGDGVGGTGEGNGSGDSHYNGNGWGRGNGKGGHGNHSSRFGYKGIRS